MPVEYSAGIALCACGSEPYPPSQDIGHLMLRMPRVPMESEQLRLLQAPLKEKYRQEPEQALVKIAVRGDLDLADLSCEINTSAGQVIAGLHEAAGGDGTQACSADMLLEALVACSGVTFAAVATALEIPIKSCRVEAEGELDFRGTLGVVREVPVGMQRIQLVFRVDTTAEEAQLDKLIQLTERYCVVLQSLAPEAVGTSRWIRES